jgi:inosine-uridine nucleoside N-ribohydrolase
MTKEGLHDIAVITDIGVDDALALILLNKLAVYNPKTLISTFGNTNAIAVEKNAIEFVAHMSGPEIADWVSKGVKVTRGGRLEGLTEFSRENPACNVAMRVRQPEETAAYIFKMMFTV